MSGGFKDAFSKLDLTNLPEGEEVPEEKMKAQKEIDILEGWLKLVETNASDKEKYNFATSHGFVSETHLKLWISVSGDCSDTLWKIEEMKDVGYPKKEIKKEEEKLEELQYNKSSIRVPSYYRLVMKHLGMKDISPYGEDLLKPKKSDTFFIGSF